MVRSELLNERVIDLLIDGVEVVVEQDKFENYNLYVDGVHTRVFFNVRALIEWLYLEYCDGVEI